MINFEKLGSTRSDAGVQVRVDRAFQILETLLDIGVGPADRCEILRDADVAQA